MVEGVEGVLEVLGLGVDFGGGVFLVLGFGEVGLAFGFEGVFAVLFGGDVFFECVYAAVVVFGAVAGGVAGGDEFLAVFFAGGFGGFAFLAFLAAAGLGLQGFLDGFFAGGGFGGLAALEGGLGFLLALAFLFGGLGGVLVVEVSEGEGAEDGQDDVEFSHGWCCLVVVGFVCGGKGGAGFQGLGFALAVWMAVRSQVMAGRLGLGWRAAVSRCWVASSWRWSS